VQNECDAERDDAWLRLPLTEEIESLSMSIDDEEDEE